MDTEKIKSHNKAAILWLIFFFPIGLIVMWSKTTWKKSVKWAITGVLAFLVIVSIISNGNSSSATQVSASKASPTPTPAITQQMKNDYISFYKQYMAIANKSDSTNNKVITDIQTVASGTSTLSTAYMYLEASDAHDTQDSLKNEEVQLQIPNSLSIYSDDLNNAQTQLFALINDREDAMTNIEDFLNTNDLSKIKNVRNDINSQKSDMEQAVVSIVTVGDKLGVNTSTIQVN